MGKPFRLKHVFKSSKKKVEEDEFQNGNFMDVLRYADTKDWILFGVGMIGSLLVGIVRPLVMFVFRGITDVMVEGKVWYENGKLMDNMEIFTQKVVPFIYLYFAMAFVTFTITFISMSCMFTLCERQVHKIRKKLFQAIINQNMEWFDKNEVGALTQKMSTGIEKIKFGFSDKLCIMIQASATLISGIFTGFYLSWNMALLMLIVAPFVILSIFGSAKAITESLRGEMNAYSSAGGVAEEVLSGIRTVASFNAQYFEIKRYEKYLTVGKKLGIRKATTIAIFSGIYLFILFSAMGIAFWYGTTLALNNAISSGTVFAAFWSVLIGAMQIGEALPQINVIMSAKMAVGEIFSIIDRKPNPECSSEVGIKLAKVKGRIDFSNMHFSYPARPAVKILNGVSLTVKAGESVALVGHSGCGKSTIISLLMRYYNLKQGSISFDGIPIQDLNVEWLRNTIGIVSQEPIIFANTVEFNLRMGKEDATTKEIIDACTMANAHEFIIKLPEGYNTQIGDGGVKLSGGQKQRIAIARALVRQPKILLLDEATSALDTESEHIVQKALDQASSGRTTITIAHRLSTIRKADKIIVFDHGEIVEEGTHDKLLEVDGVYRQLIAAQEIKRHSYDDNVVIDNNDDENQLEKNKRSYLQSDRRDSIQSITRFSQLSKSLISLNSESCQFENAIDDFEKEGIKPATLLSIIKYAEPEKKLIIAGVILSIIMGTSWPIFSIIYGQMFLILSDAIKTNEINEAMNASIWNSVFYCILGVGSGISTFGAGFLFGMVGEKLTMRMRLCVFKNLLRQDGDYFDNKQHSTGKLTTRLALDAPNVQAAIDQRLSAILQGVVSLISGFMIAFFFGWNVAPFGLIAAIILVVLQTSVRNYLKRRAVTDLELAEAASKIATESIEHVKTVQSLTRQKFVYDSFCVVSSAPHRAAIIRGLWQSVEYALTACFMQFNFGLSYTFGLMLIRGGYTNPFIVFQVLEALNMAAFTVMKTASYFSEYSRAKLSAGLMFSMMSKQPKIDSLSEVGEKTPIKGYITANKLFFAYPNTRNHLVLNGLSFKADFGCKVALVGASGCGKSTIIQLLERFYDVLSGNLLLDGKDIHQFNIRHLRSAMALVGQEPTLFNLSVKDNISYGLENISIGQIEDAAKLANIHEFIESLPDKYETLVGGKGGLLSGGQKQRIAIARAIIRNPKILLLDEATSALDTENEKVVQEALDRASAGRTCIVIAHRLSTIQRADLIVVVQDGRACEFGNHQQLLMRKGLYWRLVEKQSK